MPLRANQISMLASAIGSLQPMHQPADASLRAFFRNHSELGQRDRSSVAEGVFAWLRRRRTVEAFAASQDPRKLALTVLVREFGHSLRELGEAIDADEYAWLASRKGDTVSLSPAESADVPNWLWDALGTFLSESERGALTRSWHLSAPLDLRINPLTGRRDDIAEVLARDGIASDPTPYSPLGLRLTEKLALQKHPLFLSGQIEVQDEGSQLIAFLIAPRRHEMVVDFCAGAGGKTLLLGALMNSQGRLYAFDTSERRLANLKPRLRRSGLSNVYPQVLEHERDSKVRRLAGKIDRVLVDAPCSGVGTLRRNPDLKWRQNANGVVEMSAKQARLLEAASALIKPGGRLVYATCSVLPAENRDVVETFLRNHPDFRPLDARAILAAQNIYVPIAVQDANAGYLQLWPHLHQCDGFFAAVLERAKPGKTA